MRGPEGFGKSYDTDITDLDDVLVSGEVKLLIKQGMVMNSLGRLVERHGSGQ